MINKILNNFPEHNNKINNYNKTLNNININFNKYKTINMINQIKIKLYNKNTYKSLHSKA